ncbi:MULTISPECIES: hypothetical protein [Prochlorococcus]|uniref:hypothetical protein n=1 Tax=Prochlorococcus TaxID=1218 RepID=UPI0005337748|nr:MULTISPECIES: hypothetical protein [Prochlorococcus]KGG12432.1 hypothetical protein EV05_1644 [Prochlorococcus sp. MIT 0601]
MPNSFWDNSILRKYNSLSHFRLLSQLKSELKAYPIKRSNHKDNKQQTNYKSKEKQSIINNKSHLTANEKSYTTLYNNNIESSNSRTTSEDKPEKKDSHSTYRCNLNNIDQYQNQDDQILLGEKEINKTFIERLNDIDLR